MKSKKIKTLVLLAFFSTIMVILANTPLGYVPIGPINATTLHIPVILAGILLGKKNGAIIGFVFGLTSFLRSTFYPGPASFIFTPFYSVGNVSGNFYSLLIAFGPRLLLGYLSGLTFEKLKINNVSVKIAIVALMNTLIHTALVLMMVYIFFTKEYAAVLNVSVSGLKAALLAVIGTNGIMEAILALFVCVAVYKATHKIVERMMK